MVCVGGGVDCVSSFFDTHAMSALAHGVAVPQQHQKHRQHVKGTTRAMVDCVMHVWLNLSHPGSDRSCVTREVNGSYWPQHPPQKQQHGMQQRESREPSAAAFSVNQQVISSSEREHETLMMCSQYIMGCCLYNVSIEVLFIMGLQALELRALGLQALELQEQHLMPTRFQG